jgi:hypothetical protein
MIYFANLLGKLNASAFPHDLITLGAAISILVGAIAIAAFITYKKKWKWLWNDWLTSVDPKKIGVMYIIVAILMLFRGGADALMLRAQQATSVQ